MVGWSMGRFDGVGRWVGRWRWPLDRTLHRTMGLKTVVNPVAGSRWTGVPASRERP